MSWFRADPDDPDVSGLRVEPERPPGVSPGRIFLGVFLVGSLVGLWLVMPLGSLFSGLWSGFGRQADPPPPIAPIPTDFKDLNQLAAQHVPKPPPPPPTPPPPVERPPEAPKPDLSMYDDLASKYAWLAQQYADLEAKLKSTPAKAEPPKPTPSPPVAKPAKGTPEKKEKRTDPIFLVRKKEEKVGQTHALKSPYSLAPATVIPCETTMEISSDTPGAFVAIVSRDVPDTATRTHTVIPKGSQFVMRPRGKLIFGDSRIDIQTSTLTFPGGSWLNLVKHTVTNRAGTAGFTGEIDRHYFRLFGSILLTGVLRSGTTIATGGYSGGIGQQIGGAVAQESAAEGTRQVRQGLRTDPTVTIANHYSCKLLLEEEAVLIRSFGKYVP